ncbi:MAG: phage protein Gp27 family protein [Candidatus Binatus sp.]
MDKSKTKRELGEILPEVESIWRAGHFTLDELLEWAREKKPDAEISRTGLGRHLAKAKRAFDKIGVAQEVAARVVGQLGENPRGDIAKMLVQLVGALAYTTVDQLGDKEQPPDTKDLFFLTTAIKNIASAEKTSVDRELKVRKEVKAELEKKIDAAKPKDGAPQDAVAAFERAREILRGAL